MTDFELRRRTPAGQLRYLAEQVAKTNGLDQDDRTRLVAVRMQLEQLADEVEADVPSPESLGESLGFALAAILPDAEPVFCHHEHRTVRWRTGGGVTTATATCKTCPARAESTEGEPALAPYLLNAERCTQACTERHTNGPGCLMAPDWSKPIFRSKP